MTKPLVTVITPTTGNNFLYDALRSVEKQTYSNIQHLVVIDGANRRSEAELLLRGAKVTKIQLPYATGIEQYNGHRIYGAMTFIANGDYICFLDEDNWYSDTHVEELVDAVLGGTGSWAYSLRQIRDQKGEFVCYDDCESLGVHPSVLGDKFVDVGCFFLPKHLALMLAPVWYRRARHPQEQPEVDRAISHILMEQMKVPAVGTGRYTLNYRVASRPDSVTGEFFLRGNEVMKERLKGERPWQKKT